MYLATLQRLHGWWASAVSAPVTVYYVAGALLTAAVSSLYARFGPRVVVAGGGLAMAVGLVALGRVGQPWQLYPAFLVMSVGWGALSGAAIALGACAILQATAAALILVAPRPRPLSHDVPQYGSRH